MLRILCFHGYRQNEQSFRERTGAFRKVIKKHAELVFITAPHRVPPLPPAEGDAAAADRDKGDTDERGWWFSRENDYYKAIDVTDCCKGFDESLEVVRKAFEELGPFDGVLGFSQGACLLGLICSLREKDPETYKFRFAIFVAGFKSRNSPHDDFYNTQITIPTLHVFGETDKVIQKEMSEELLPCYTDPVILTHPGGHFIPASSAQKNVYLDFLNKMIALKNS